MVSENVQRSIRSVFDKNFRGFIIDNMTVKREIGLYYGVEKKVSIVRQGNLEERNHSF